MRNYDTGAIAIGALACAFSFATLPAYGQDGDEDAATSVGIALLYRTQPYCFTEVSPRPLIDLEYGPLSISGSTADLRTPVSGESWAVTLRARYGLGDGYEAGDDASLAGMEDRDGSMWAGLGFNAELGSYEVSAEWLFDTMDNSAGSQIEVGLSRTFQESRFQLSPRVSAIWMSDEVVDYYYGVTPGEATPLRPAYEGTATTGVEVGFTAVYPVTRHHLLMLDLSATAYGENIGDSPIVQDDITGRVGVGYAFRF